MGLSKRCLLSTCTIGSFGESVVCNSKKPIKTVSINNQPCQARPTIVDINSKNLFYPFTGSFNKCSGSYNASDDPCAGVCVPNKVKKLS